MRLLFIAMTALLLQGCAAVYSLSPSVDAEAFQARGKSVAVQYAMRDRSPADACSSNIVFVVNPCRDGSPEDRANELVQMLGGYGFTAWRDGARGDVRPDYTIVVEEVATGFEQSTKDLGQMMLSSFTIGLFPAISDTRPSQLSYTLYKNGARGQARLHQQAASTHVKTLGGIYFLVLGPVNHEANKASLMTEHERALQNWIQGGLFE